MLYCLALEGKSVSFVLNSEELREKIGDKYFKTIKGVGYKFIIEE